MNSVILAKRSNYIVSTDDHPKHNVYLHIKNDDGQAFDLTSTGWGISGGKIIHIVTLPNDEKIRCETKADAAKVLLNNANEFFSEWKKLSPDAWRV